jgi:hypothetical protein
MYSAFLFFFLQCSSPRGRGETHTYTPPPRQPHEFFRSPLFSAAPGLIQKSTKPCKHTLAAKQMRCLCIVMCGVCRCLFSALLSVFYSLDLCSHDAGCRCDERRWQRRRQTRIRRHCRRRRRQPRFTPPRLRASRRRPASTACCSLSASLCCSVAAPAQ